jgi:choline dehydrogenase-like flavoprotein
MSEEIRTDYFIAGAGIAGILLAGRLAASGRRVLLADQGPRFSEADRAGIIRRIHRTLNDFADYNDETDPAMITPHTSAGESAETAPWSYQRVYGIGGTALHFDGIMIRPLAEDLQVKTLYGYGRDWPISYAELEPWLQQAEIEIGVAGGDDNPYAAPRSGPYPMPAHPFSYFDREICAPALQKLGMTGHSSPRAIASRPYRGRAACQACRACHFCPSGARYSPDRVHAPLLDRQANVNLLPKVSLRRLETSADGGRIVAAHAVRVEDRAPVVVRAEHYILALGGVATPHLLMLSTDGKHHRQGLGNAGGQLGRGFSDHFNLFATLDAGRPVGSRLGFETMICEHARVRINRREQPGFILFPAPSIDWYPIGIEATAWGTRGDTLSLDEVRASIPRMAGVYAMTELSGQGTLELDEGSRDVFGDPVAKISLKLTDWDRRSIRAFGELVPRLAEAMAARNVGAVYPLLNMGYHPSGATAMAATPDAGVCDTDLKVFGLDNLFVVGNSVFPHMGANPPTLTISALALRLAAHLKGRKA